MDRFSLFALEHGATPLYNRPRTKRIIRKHPVVSCDYCGGRITLLKDAWVQWRYIREPDPKAPPSVETVELAPTLYEVLTSMEFPAPLVAPEPEPFVPSMSDKLKRLENEVSSVLEQRGPLTIGEIKNEIERSVADTKAAIASLERRGLIHRQQEQNQPIMWAIGPAPKPEPKPDPAVAPLSGYAELILGVLKILSPATAGMIVEHVAERFDRKREGVRIKNTLLLLQKHGLAHELRYPSARTQWVIGPIPASALDMTLVHNTEQCTYEGQGKAYEGDHHGRAFLRPDREARLLQIARRGSCFNSAKEILNRLRTLTVDTNSRNMISEGW